MIISACERHQDYVYTAPPLIPGEPMIGLKLLLDADFPFEMRSMAARIPAATVIPVPLTQDGIQFVSARWSGPDGEDYRQRLPVPLNVLLAPFYGLMGSPRRVYPPVLYPANGVITIDLINNGPNVITGLQLFFRGVKKYPVGSLPLYTYPETMARAPLPFSYPITLLNLAPVETRQPQPFEPDNDSDFAFRSGYAGAFSGLAAEVFITLMDEAQKPYSNAPVPIDVMFGRFVFPFPFPVGNTFIASVPGGGAAPGLLVPEIYIPRRHKMWFQITRNEVLGGLGNVTLPLIFSGAKVYPGGSYGQ